MHLLNEAKPFYTGPVIRILLSVGNGPVKEIWLAPVSTPNKVKENHDHRD